MMLNRNIIFHTLGIPQKDYIKKYVIPVLIFMFLFPVIVLLGAPDISGDTMLVVLWSPLILLFLVILYPFINIESKRKEIDNSLHYYITHMGVLATTQMSRIEILHHLSKNEAYGYLATETERIYALVTYWNLSFPVACSFIAKRTPSVLFSDFLDRLAHAIHAGAKFDEFVIAEQTVVMNDFVTMYKEALHSTDVIKELFVSMSLSLIFLVSFSIIMPIITGLDTKLMVTGAIIMYLVVEIVILMYTRTKVPTDRIWHTLEIETKADQMIKWSMPVSLMLCMIVSSILILFSDLPVTILFASSLTPLLITGIIAQREENKIKRYDENFGAFIRSLGSMSGARSGLILESLRVLVTHDFGPLSDNIKRLYKRLKLQIKTMKAWEHFAAGTGSNLIERFATMFVEGTNLGGKPDVIGNIISMNFMEILSMRKLRYSSAGGLVGILYGMTIGLAVTMFLSISIIAMLAKLFSSTKMPDMDIGLSINTVINTDVGLLTTMIMFMMVGHSFISASLIRIIDGGHHFNTYVHLVGLVWVSALAAEVTMRGMIPLLGI
ncbi:MAG: archaellar assembly protein FlaJ [Candidatus Methanoperedens sp.]|nr:archaellar assembly protein FlaJ [Candidatus Methanoperedens sp.]PKL54030.1 MAG: type II secretion protein F [Candidatus Methanoperedenaceae archaeon HGW-Methanoperedenaceae-1]